MSLTEKTLRSVKWEALSLLIKGTTQIAFLAILARYLSPEDFGLMAIITITINFLNMLTELGLGASLIQRKEINALHIRGAYTTTMLISLLFVVGLYCVAPIVADFFKAPKVVIYIRSISLIFPLFNLGTVSRSILHRKMKFKKMFWINFFSEACGYVPSGIIAAIFGLGVWSLIIALFTSIIINTTLSFLSAPHSLIPILPKKEVSELLLFGTGLSLARFSLYFANYGDNLVVGRSMNVATLGLYEPIFRIMAMPGQYLGTLLDRLLFPAMATIQGEHKKLESIYLKALSMINSILLPFSVIFILSSKEIVLLLLGSKWNAAILPLQILSLAIAFRTSVRISDSVIRAVGAVYDTAARKAIYAIILIVACWIGHFWGLPYVAVGVVVASFINYTLTIHLAFTLIKIKYFYFFSVLKTGLILSAIALIVNIPFISLLRILIDIPSLILTTIIVYNIFAIIVMVYVLPWVFDNNLRWLSSKLFSQGRMNIFF